jgi:hypothetical protein
MPNSNIDDARCNAGKALYPRKSNVAVRIARELTSRWLAAETAAAFVFDRFVGKQDLAMAPPPSATNTVCSIRDQQAVLGNDFSAGSFGRTLRIRASDLQTPA